MSSHKLMDQLNMDASIGFHFNFYDSNSNCFYHIRDDSISSGSKLFKQVQEGYQPIRHFNHQNTINFDDLDKIGPSTEPFYRELTVQLSSRAEKDSPEWKSQSGQSSRRGLKYLARLLLKTLNHRRSFSQGEVSELIENILYKGRQPLKMYKEKMHSKEEKNIRRRIYDALNVMMSAGLLEREVKMKSPLGTTNFNPDYKEQIALIRLKIEKKKELLSKLQSKRDALEYWILRNKQKMELCTSSEKMIFPLIFVINSSGEEMWKQYEQQFLIIKNRGLQFLSETDLIELVYEKEKKKEMCLRDDLTESNE